MNFTLVATDLTLCGPDSEKSQRDELISDPQLAHIIIYLKKIFFFCAY